MRYEIEIPNDLWMTICHVANVNGIDQATLIRAAIRLIGRTYAPEIHGPFTVEVVRHVREIVEVPERRVEHIFHEAVDMQGKTMKEIKKLAFLQSYQRHKGEIKHVAEELGIAFKTAYTMRKTLSDELNLEYVKFNDSTGVES